MIRHTGWRPSHNAKSRTAQAQHDVNYPVPVLLRARVAPNINRRLQWLMVLQLALFGRYTIINTRYTSYNQDIMCQRGKDTTIHSIQCKENEPKRIKSHHLAAVPYCTVDCKQKELLPYRNHTSVEDPSSSHGCRVQPFTEHHLDHLDHNLPQ